MADVFLSYVRSDAERAKQIAEALEARGWSVWWDTALTPGMRFRDKIAEELHAARCVVVLWSNQSIASDWVIDEAEDGKRRRVLVQALIEDVRPPHGFRQIQAAMLMRWDGTNSGEFVRLCAGISTYAPRYVSLESSVSTDPRQAPPLTLSRVGMLLSDLPIREQWLALERRFNDVDASTLVVKRADEGESLWRVTGSENPRREFQSLGEVAGALLQKSPRVWAEIRWAISGGFGGVVDAPDDFDRWLRFLEPKQIGLWVIRDPVKRSAEACAKCADKEANQSEES